MRTDTVETAFLPAERADPEQIRQLHACLESSGPLRQVLEKSAEPILILNEKRQIVYANHHFLEICPAPDGAVGMRTGEAFGCVNSILSDGGCGTSTQCRACQIANAVLSGLKWSSGEGIQTLKLSGDPPSRVTVGVQVESLLLGTNRLLFCRLTKVDAQIPTR